MKLNHIKKKSGQGLVEYLIIVAIIGIGSMAIMRVVGGSLNVKFADVAIALGARGDRGERPEVTSSMTKKKDLNSFFDGAVNQRNNNSQREQ